MTASIIDRGDARGEAASIRPATILSLGEPGRAHVRIPGPGGRSTLREARLARITGYEPSPGDRVLVAERGAEAYVLAVLAAAVPPALELPGGGVASVRDGAVEVRDATGKLLVRYADGAAEMSAPARDLALSAPNGRVVLRSGEDVTIEAGRDIVERAGRSLDLGAGGAEAAPQIHLSPGAVAVKTERFSLEATQARVAVGRAGVLARSIAVTADHVAEHVERYELHATKIVEKTKESLREAADLLETKVGRARTLVRGTFSLRSGKSALVSTDDTSIDGRKVLLG